MVEKIRGVVTPELDTLEPYRERLGYQCSNRDNYALRAAATKGHVEVVELLLSHLDMMDISNSELVAAFEDACKNGQRPRGCHRRCSIERALDRSKYTCRP